MARELILYCDESDISGKHFANFYGGLLIESSNLEEVERRIRECCQSLNLHDEVKWQKISTAYASKYTSLIDELFDLVAEGKVKIRIMFTQNYFSPYRLTPDQREMGFFLLYYQFVKHGFGLQYAGLEGTSTSLRVLFDKLPDTAEKCARFKGYLAALTQSPGFRKARIELRPESISEVDSRRHVLLQCVDIVLGAMQFRLNDKHKEKPPGKRVRGKRTVAKERVYRHVLQRIRSIYPNFNIGISTGVRGEISNRWSDPYRHWLFKQENAVIRPEFAKRKKPRVR